MLHSFCHSVKNTPSSSIKHIIPQQQPVSFSDHSYSSSTPAHTYPLRGLLIPQKELSKTYQLPSTSVRTWFTALSPATIWKAACIFSTHISKIFLSCLNVMELWSLSSTSFCLQKNKSSLFRIKFYHNILLLSSCCASWNKCIKHKGGKCACFSSPPLTPCTSLAFFQASKSHWIKNNCSHSEGAIQNQHLSRHRSHAGTLASAWVLLWHMTRAPCCSADCQFTQFELSVQKFSMMQSAR